MDEMALTSRRQPVTPLVPLETEDNTAAISSSSSTAAVTATVVASDEEERQCAPKQEAPHTRLLLFSKRIKVMMALHPLRVIVIVSLLSLLFLGGVATVVSLTKLVATSTVTSATATVTVTSSTKTTKQQQAEASPLLAEKPKPKPTLKDMSRLSSLYQNCTVSTPPSRATWTTKPLWFPSYPNSIDENMMKTLVTQMTGLSAGAKSFYASSKRMGLRQCYGKTETALCMLIHPMVEMTPGPEAKVSLFDPHIIYAMRHPMTTIPAFLNGKRIKYAKLTGQQPQDEWRKMRDETFMLDNGGLWDGWKRQLQSWLHHVMYNKRQQHEKPYYKIGMYLIYEHLMDMERGPRALEQLLSIFHQAGFPTAPKEDMKCLWYQTFVAMPNDGSGGLLEHYIKYGYEFDDYMPGYTNEQLDYMISEMKTLILQYDDGANHDDMSNTRDESDKSKDLVNILKEYHDSILHDVRTDIPWENKTSNI